MGIVIPGRCEASNPESRDSGSGPSDHPGMTTASHPGLTWASIIYKVNAFISMDCRIT
jgi:hypothetical protein